MDHEQEQRRRNSTVATPSSATVSYSVWIQRSGSLTETQRLADVRATRCVEEFVMYKAIHCCQLSGPNPKNRRLS